MTPAPGANLADLVRSAAARVPDRTAVVAGTTRLTWADLDRRVDDLARALVLRDLRPTDRVGLAAAGAVEFTTAYLAALRAGLIVVPLDHTAAAAEITATLRRTTARLLIVDGPTAATGTAAAGRGARARRGCRSADARRGRAHAGRAGRGCAG